MQHPRRALAPFSLAAALALASVPATLAQQLQQPTPAEILNQVAQRTAQRQTLLSSYTSTRTYHIDYTGIGGPRTAELVVRAEYHAPGEKTFTVLSESGSRMICTRVLHKLVESEQEASNRSSQFQSALSPDNYDATFVGQEQVGGIDTWVLDVAPKIPNKFAYRGRIWVSIADSAIVHIQGEPAKNPSFWLSKITIDSRYEQVGPFWLPASNTSVSHIRIGGEARLTINYGTYTVKPVPVETAQLHNASLTSTH